MTAIGLVLILLGLLEHARWQNKRSADLDALDVAGSLSLLSGVILAGAGVLLWIWRNLP